MKKLLIALGLLAVVSVNAAQQTKSYTINPGSIATNLSTTGMLIYEIKVYAGGGAGDGSATAVNWKILNAYITNTTTHTRVGGFYEQEFRVGAYTNYSYVYYPTSYMVTNYFGGTNVVSNANFYASITNLSPGMTNSYDIVAQASTATNTVTTITFSSPYFAFRGLYMTNNPCFTNTHNPSYITITYDPVL